MLCTFRPTSCGWPGHYLLRGIIAWSIHSKVLYMLHVMGLMVVCCGYNDKSIDTIMGWIVGEC